MLPTLYISHGSPMLALEPGASGVQPRRLATELPRPKAILVVSAHWESDDLRVTGAAVPDIWHDFYGFPPPLRRALPGQRRAGAGTADDRTAPGRRPAGPGRPTATIRPRHLGAAEPDVPAGGHPGAPAVPAEPPRSGPAEPRRPGPAPTARGRRAADRFRQHHPQPGRTGLARRAGAIAPWAREFRDWMVEKLQADDQAALHDYRRQAPWAARNHPSDEHLLPLFFARGAAAADARRAQRLYPGLVGDGYLSLRLTGFLGDWRRASASRRKLGGLGWQPGNRERHSPVARITP